MYARESRKGREKVRRRPWTPSASNRAGGLFAAISYVGPSRRGCFFFLLSLPQTLGSNALEFRLDLVHQTLDEKIGALFQGQKLQSVEGVHEVHGWHVNAGDVLVEKERQARHEALSAAVSNG